MNYKNWRTFVCSFHHWPIDEIFSWRDWSTLFEQQMKKPRGTWQNLSN